MRIALEKILCPVDFSENAEHALLYALTLAKTYGADLCLLHVMEPPVYDISGDYLDPEFSAEVARRHEEACQARLKEIEATARKDYERVRSLLVSGVPLVGIVDTARGEGTDLIVMGTHGRTGLVHALIGSVAERVVRKSPCPVLTVKHPEHEFVLQDTSPG